MNKEKDYIETIAAEIKFPAVIVECTGKKRIAKKFAFDDVDANSNERPKEDKTQGGRRDFIIMDNRVFIDHPEFTSYAAVKSPTDFRGWLEQECAVDMFYTRPFMSQGRFKEDGSDLDWDESNHKKEVKGAITTFTICPEPKVWSTDPFLGVDIGKKDIDTLIQNHGKIFIGRDAYSYQSKIVDMISADDPEKKWYHGMYNHAHPSGWVIIQGWLMFDKNAAAKILKDYKKRCAKSVKSNPKLTIDDFRQVCYCIEHVLYNYLDINGYDTGLNHESWDSTIKILNRFMDLMFASPIVFSKLRRSYRIGNTGKTLREFLVKFQKYGIYTDKIDAVERRLIRDKKRIEFMKSEAYHKDLLKTNPSAKKEDLINMQKGQVDNAIGSLKRDTDMVESEKLAIANMRKTIQKIQKFYKKFKSRRIR